MPTKPYLKKVSVFINPDIDTHYKLVRQKPYYLIDIEAPEVALESVQAVARANCKTYERAINKFFAGDFYFDESELTPPEPREIYFLDTMRSAITGGTYLLTLTILEF